MQKKIQSALISVFYKDGIDSIARKLHDLGITIYSTGGTQEFLQKNNIPCVAVESLTTYPSILGGRVKTLHPVVFGAILGRRNEDKDAQEMKLYNIPEIDLVIVDLYPFEETLRNSKEEPAIIEKIDIGGPSMIRAAAKNYRDVLVVADKSHYPALAELLDDQKGNTTIEQRRQFAARAFEVVMYYDIAISNYFNPLRTLQQITHRESKSLRYGENPHQDASFDGELQHVFAQLHGKELSYNNLVDVDAAIQLISEFDATTFAIIKHTNVCGIASRSSVKESWDAALAGDPESAFGGVLVCNREIDKDTAAAIGEIFFEVLIAPSFAEAALEILQSKKNRILLRLQPEPEMKYRQFKSLLNGTLMQNRDEGSYNEWNEAGGRTTTENERADLEFANLVCKHLKSNAIALVKNRQLVGKGCGQTSRIDALRQAIEKARQFSFDLKGAVLASDAFFPFNDCVQMAHAEGVEAFIQPGGSIRDKESIDYCVQHGLAMVLTGMRHFRH
ncbi:MAG TPA: bifunctional phosphoribosylaminoimidazolecarboxamide formyltransferase/IMP cyclohydrolase [Chitinophagaceae bacterium]